MAPLHCEYMGDSRVEEQGLHNLEEKMLNAAEGKIHWIVFIYTLTIESFLLQNAAIFVQLKRNLYLIL